MLVQMVQELLAEVASEAAERGVVLERAVGVVVVDPRLAAPGDATQIVGHRERRETRVEAAARESPVDGIPVIGDEPLAFGGGQDGAVLPMRAIASMLEDAER